MYHYGRRGIYALAVVMLGACGEGPPRSDEPLERSSVEALDWAEAYALVDSIEPEQSDSMPIVYIAGVDFNDGYMALADPSEGTVKVFAREPGYPLLHVLGGKGDGPGEYNIPFYPRFDSNGGLHVADAGRNRIAVYDTLGAVPRILILNDIINVRDFDILPNGEYLLSAVLLGDSLNALFRFDPTGAELSRYMPVRRMLPQGETPNVLWVRVHRAAAELIDGGRTVVSTVTILDSLWTVDLQTGQRQSIQLRPPGYVAPTLEDIGRPRPPREAQAWIDSTTMIPELFSNGTDVYVPFAKGIYHQSEYGTLLVGTPGGAWKAIAQAPPVVDVIGDTVISLLPDTITYKTRFARWAPRD